MGRGAQSPQIEVPWKRERIVLILCLVGHGFRKLHEIVTMLYLQSPSSLLLAWIGPMVKAGLLSKDGLKGGTLALTEQGRALLRKHVVLWREGRPKQVFELEVVE